MKRSPYTASREASSKNYSSFERREKSKGGSGRSYSKDVSVPRAVQVEKQRLILVLALTVILPPVGIACLWRGGFLRVQYRAAATFAAFWLMVLYFSWMIPESAPNVVQPQMKRPAAVTQYSSSSGGNGNAGADNGY